MEITRTLHVTTRVEWWQWLDKNHNTENEIWLIFYKKHTGKSRIPYNDAVEEAICFGWIDSIVKRIDDEKFAQKFTPRKKNSKWSDLNIKRAKKMISENKMTQSGLIYFQNIPDKKNGQPAIKMDKNNFNIPEYINEALKKNLTVLKNFNQLAFSHKRNYVGWIDSAKKEETRQNRLAEAIELLKENKKLGLK